MLVIFVITLTKQRRPAIGDLQTTLDRRIVVAVVETFTHDHALQFNPKTFVPVGYSHF